jgi:hypothetical protein
LPRNPLNDTKGKDKKLFFYAVNFRVLSWISWQKVFVFNFSVSFRVLPWQNPAKRGLSQDGPVRI